MGGFNLLKVNWRIFIIECSKSFNRVRLNITTVVGGFKYFFKDLFTPNVWGSWMKVDLR